MQIQFFGTNVRGIGEVVFNSSGQAGTFNLVSKTLITDPGIVIRTGSGGGFIGQSSDNFDNGGRISAQTLNQRITIAATNFTNRGVLEARDGGTLQFNRLTSTGTIRAIAGGSPLVSAMCVRNSAALA